MTKVCTKCNIEYPDTKEHFILEKRNKSGIGAQCRKCHNAANRVWRAGNRKSQSFYFKGYRRNCKSKYFSAKYRRKYGISYEQYEVMFRDQGGVCRVCGKPDTHTTKSGIQRRLAVDHNHNTGEVRGLLCQRCNQALGLLRENPVAIKSLLEYIT